MKVFLVLPTENFYSNTYFNFFSKFLEGQQPCNPYDEPLLIRVILVRGSVNLNKSYSQRNNVLVLFTASGFNFPCDGNHLAAKYYF
jgi:hypothetical protein